MTCKDAADMLTPALMERTREMKETGEGVKKMNVASEQIKAEAFGSGRQEGMLNTLFGLVRGGAIDI